MLRTAVLCSVETFVLWYMQVFCHRQVHPKSRDKSALYLFPLPQLS